MNSDKKSMNFFLKMHPPTTTAQEHKVATKGKKVRFYDPPALKDAKEKLLGYLYAHAPDKKLEGPIALEVTWYFYNEKHGEDWKVTKPDTDNLQKMLKDCMTKLGYWNDDAQVVHEVVQKRWTNNVPGIWIRLEEI